MWHIFQATDNYGLHKAVYITCLGDAITLSTYTHTHSQHIKWTFNTNKCAKRKEIILCIYNEMNRCKILLILKCHISIKSKSLSMSFWYVHARVSTHSAITLNNWWMHFHSSCNWIQISLMFRGIASLSS